MFGKIGKKAVETAYTPETQKLIESARAAFKNSCDDLEQFVKKDLASNADAIKGLEQLSKNIKCMLPKK